MFSSFSIAHADDEKKKDARQALSIILLISFAPLFLGFIGALTVDDSASKSFVNVFLSGELYFYAMSLCGSIYSISQLNNHKSNLGMRLWSGMFVFACGVLMALYIGQSSSTDGYFSPFHAIASVAFLAVAIFVNFRVMVLAEQPPPTPDEVNRERAADMTEAVDADYD